MRESYLHCYTPYQEQPDTPRFLVTLDVGIGDAVAVGLSAVDQIVEDDPLAAGTIDVLSSHKKGWSGERVLLLGELKKKSSALICSILDCFFQDFALELS